MWHNARNPDTALSCRYYGTPSFTCGPSVTLSDKTGRAAAKVRKYTAASAYALWLRDEMDKTLSAIEGPWHLDAMDERSGVVSAEGRKSFSYRFLKRYTPVTIE